ncbi:MAG TPA: hypothetical protein VFR85_15935 [Anaeromyxobacteraceae bacterium]|nr:hypothetical protein [Anaeromyxobacteraceae bacterium]
MRLKVLSSLLALGIATAAVAQAPPPAFTFTFKGFVGASVFVQDASMGITPVGNNNQTGQIPVFAGNNAWNQGAPDKLMFGGDVRQTRLNFAVKGPTIGGDWTPNGVVELDWSGGFGGAPFGDENLLPRIRLAYVELSSGSNTIRVGQAHNLLVGFIPASAAHIAFPFAYGAGLIGWRSPGITYLYKTTTSGGLNMEYGVQINRNSWYDLTASGTPVSQGEASGLPQVQARVMVSQGKNTSPFPLYPVADWLFFVAGHYDVKDLTNVAAVAGTNQKDKLTTYAVQAGYKSNQIENLTLAVNGWFGQNTGNLLGMIVQIGPVAQSPANQDLASVTSYGVWGQVGYAFGGPWSLWGMMGFENPDWKDAVWAFQTANNPGGAARVRNVNSAAMLAWREGSVVLGLEWLHSFTTYGYGALPAAGGPPPTITTYSRNANQYMLTADYFF